MSEEFVPGPENRRVLRDALGCFGTGVTVVTAPGPRGPLGITVNSFASLSIDPPLVLWAPARLSLRHDVFVAAPHFAVHVLSEDQHALAVHFATTGEQFDGIDWHPGPDRLPRLGGCLARFDCAREAVHDGGDHSLVIGRVIRASHRPGRGLMFKRGRYGGFDGLV